MIPVVLAGGDGLRMRPLTCTIPKALMPVCGKTLIEYTLELLSEQGFEKCIVAADNLSRQITSAYDDNVLSGMDIDFSVRPSPCGTTAAVSYSAKNIAEDILIVPSDTLADFDFNEEYQYHLDKKADITLIVKKIYDNSEISSVLTDNNGFAEEIIVNPSRENGLDVLALTGFCIISEKAVSLLGGYDGDLMTEVIPGLIKKGIAVAVYEEKGFFLDVNTHLDLLAAQKAVLYGKYPYQPSGIIRLADDSKGFRISPPAYIDRNSSVDEGVTIEAGTVIGANVTVCKGAKIHGSLLFDGAYIGERATINEAVIADSARVLTSAGVFEGAVVGENAVIAENAVVSAGVKIWNGRHIEANTCADNDVKYGFAKPLQLDEEGVCGETNGLITPQIAAVLGSTAVTIGNKIGIGYRENASSKALALAFVSGVMAAGGEAWLFGECIEPELSYSVRSCSLNAGCYIDSGVTAKIKFISSDGLPLTRAEEKIIEGGLNRSEYKKASFTHFGELKECNSFNELYRMSLAQILPYRLSDINAEINTSGSRIAKICGDILKPINDKNGERIIFHISSDGQKTSAYTEGTGYVFHEKLMLLCCQKCFQAGLDVSLPYSFPSAADKLASRYGSSVLRYCSCSADSSDREARAMAVKNSFVTDAIALMLSVLDILTTNCCTLKQAVGEIPDFATANRFIPLEDRPSNILRDFCFTRQGHGEGVVVNDNRGRVLIRPVKTGKGVMMYVESFAAETAGEICDFYTDLLTHKHSRNAPANND